MYSLIYCGILLVVALPVVAYVWLFIKYDSPTTEPPPGQDVLGHGRS